MTGIIIQQITLSELELAIRRVVHEELVANNISKDIFQPPENSDTSLLSKKEAANLLRVSLPTFTKMIKEGKVKSCRVGQRLRFKKNQILSIINLN